MGADAAPTATGSSSDTSTRTYDGHSPIMGMARHRARERAFTPGDDGEDRVKAQAETLGQMYSLTGGGS